MFEYEHLLLLKPSQLTISKIEHCDHWEEIRTIILSYLSGAFPD